MQHIDDTRPATKGDLRVFATKEDLHAFATKEDLNGFATKDDFRNLSLKMDDKFERVNEAIDRVLSVVVNLDKGMKGQIRDHERRLTKLESKVG